MQAPSALQCGVLQPVQQCSAPQLVPQPPQLLLSGGWQLPLQQ